MTLLSKLKGLAFINDTYVIGSLSAVKVDAAVKGIKSVQPFPDIIRVAAPSNGKEQPFGVDVILTCAQNRAKACINAIVSKGFLSRVFKKTVYGVGIQSGIVHTGFDDTIENGVHVGFTDDSWRDAEFFDRTAIVLQDDEGNRVTVWTTKMEWPDNEYVKMSAVGGEIKNTQGKTVTVKGGFNRTVSSIMVESSGDDGMKLPEEHAQDPNASFDRPGRTRGVLIEEAVAVAVQQMRAAKKSRKGNAPINLTFELEYKNDHPNDHTTTVLAL